MEYGAIDPGSSWLMAREASKLARFSPGESDALRLDTIQETVGELRNEKAPEPAAKRWARGRRLKQSFVRVLNRRDEVESEPFCLALVELSRRHELVPCFGMERNASHRSVARAFLMTFSAGIPATFPDLSSPSRRSASWSQSFSTAASTS
jgi:hypothetical protein